MESITLLRSSLKNKFNREQTNDGIKIKSRDISSTLFHTNEKNI